MAKPILERDRTGRSCPKCGVGEIVNKKGRFGEFMGCTAYQSGCRYTEEIAEQPTASKALEAEADAFLRERGFGHLTGLKDLPRGFKRR